MKSLRLWEGLLIGLTAAFLVFLAGYFAGQSGGARARGGVVIETERSASPEISAAVQSPAAGPSAPAEGTPVNINLAGKEELAELPGIGEVLAERIIAYRTENGPFRAKDELMDVDGIGEGKYAACKDWITIE